MTSLGPARIALCAGAMALFAALATAPRAQAGSQVLGDAAGPAGRWDSAVVPVTVPSDPLNPDDPADLWQAGGLAPPNPSWASPDDAQPAALRENPAGVFEVGGGAVVGLTSPASTQPFEEPIIAPAPAAAPANTVLIPLPAAVPAVAVLLGLAATARLRKRRP